MTKTATAKKLEICAYCNGVVREPDGYHSYLFCELVKLGHLNPGEYLRSYGFSRDVSTT